MEDSGILDSIYKDNGVPNIIEGLPTTYEYFVKYEYTIRFSLGSNTYRDKVITKSDVWTATCGSEIMHMFYNNVPDECEDYTMLMINRLGVV